MNEIHQKSPMFSTRETNARATVLVAAAILAIAGFRVLRATMMPELPNFSPLTAVAFCGGLLLPGAIAWILPFGALLLSDIALSAFLGYPLFSLAQASVWVCVLGMIFLGRLVAARGSFGLGGFFATLVSGSVLFYFATNAMSWLLNPAYPSGLGGLWMSLTVGLPGYPPTWTFFRNSLLSDLIFASLLLAVWVASRTEEPVRRVPATA